MNQSNPEVSRLTQEATALFNQSIPLSEEAARLYAESGNESRSKNPKEAKRLMADGDELMAKSKKLREQGGQLLEQARELKLHADSNEPSANYVTCRCQHCDTGIEFDSTQLDEENSIVPCPHCGAETKLLVSATPSPQKAEASIPTQAEIDALAKKNAQLEEIKKRLKRYETTATVYSLLDKLELAGDKIMIHRRGVANAMAAGLNGERTILISSLTAIQLKLGGWLSPGYILFSYAGSKPFAGGIFAATEDPDAFIFEQALNEQVTDFKSKVEKIMRESKQAPSATNSSGTLTDELRKLAEFRQQGILSQEEFDAAKKKLLK